MMSLLVSPFVPLTSPAVAARHGSAAEVELVARVVRGEHEALVTLYRTHQHRVRSFARRILGNEGAADDLVHELFLALPDTLVNFRHEAPLASFLVGVAARRAKHHVRAAARRRQAEQRAAEEPPPSSPSPERALEQRQLAACLADALDRLPLDQRIAFVMCEVEERTSVEVAGLLGERDGTIRGRLHLAKKKLREALSNTLSTEGS